MGADPRLARCAAGTAGGGARDGARDREASDIERGHASGAGRCPSGAGRRDNRNSGRCANCRTGLGITRNVSFWP
ncbi:hypothetical protein GCM10020360_31070 [Nonlabens tegetincola]